MTVGYQSPILTFTGRFLDSQDTGTFQQPFRTARAECVVVAPQLNRVYMLIGSAVVAYNINTFFSRLASGEPMVSATAIPVTPSVQSIRAAPYEQFLQWDKFFYAENGSPWKTIIVDGQQRLFQFDYDDQGYVYLAYSIFGWGIVKDDGSTGGGLMASQYQDLSGAGKPGLIAAFKTSTGRYYALLQGGLIYDTTNRSKPTLVRSNAGYWSSIAKDSTGTIIAIVNTGTLNIWRTDDFVAGGAPLKSFTTGLSTGYQLVTSDGTNFYADATTPSGVLVGTIRYDGITYNQTLYPTSVMISRQPVFPTGFQFGAGYIVVSGIGPGAFDLALLKIDNGVPTVVDLHDYVRNYYAVAPDQNHIVPPYTNIDDGVVYKAANGNYYLIVEAGGIGDVYQIKGADSVSTSFLGCAQLTNCAGGPFYGDTLAFQADSSTSTPVQLNWNFGNPEAAGADTNTPPSTSANQSGVRVTHQYSGITALPTTRTVSATNVTNSQMTSSLTVTLKKPSAAFGIAGTTLLIKQPDASSPAPIVAGDKFFDASDGEVLGHWLGWTVDGTQTKTTPGAANAIDVGACGTHSLVFDVHYGPYSGAGASLATVGPDFLVSISPFNYTVGPFAAAVSGPGADPSNGNNLLFSSATRMTDSTTALTYQWDLVTTANGVDTVVVAGPPAGTNGTWSLGKDAVGLHPGSRVRLIATSTSATSACAGMNSSTGYSTTLNPPPADLAIAGGCTNQGPPCVFSVTSATTPSGWTYAWSAAAVTGTSGVATPATATTATYSPSFSAVGTYQINLRVSNSVGFKDVPAFTQTVTNITTCGTMNSLSIFITASCGTGGSASCAASSSVQFGIATWQYQLECSNHTFTWNFGDGTPTVSGQKPTHAYTTAKSYTVTCVINNGAQTYTASQTVSVGTSIQPPPPPPPPPPTTGCGTMTTQNVFINYVGPTTGCNSANTVSCNTGESVSFTPSAFGSYTFACANHSFFWNFGDGHTASGSSADNTGSATNAYSTAGTYNVSLTISNGSQQITLSQAVKVGGGTVTPPPTPPPSTPPPSGNCPPMVANNNVFVEFQNATGSCSYVGASCIAGDAITFTAASFNYSFGCAAHTFSWDFGDNHSATGPTATHTYANAGTYNLTLTIANPAQSVTIHQPVTIAQSSGITGSTFDFNINPLTVSGITIPNAYVFTAVSIPAGAFSTWNWDFGDGSCPGPQPCSGSPISHIYPDTKNYTITLTVPGQPNSVTKTLQIRHRATGR